MLNTLKNSKILRWPLLTASKLLLSPLTSGPPILRRAAYDVMPTPFFVTGDREQFVVSTADKVIGRELFLHGQFDFYKLETALSILAREGIAPPRHLIDVGANIGSILIPAIKRGYFDSATAIEPHPENLRLLRANLALNGIHDKVSIFELAVGDKENITLYLEESSTNSGNHSIGSEGLSVRSTRLDDLDVPINNSLLWMDIEGYEGHALKGASQLLSSGMPVISEFNYEFLKKSNGIENFIKAIGCRKIFDLNKDEGPIELSSLVSQCESIGYYTDIMAIAAGS